MTSSQAPREKVPALIDEDLSLQNSVFLDTLDSLPAIIWYKDTENNILWGNRAALASVGAELEQIEGRSAYELAPKEAANYYRDDLEIMESRLPKLGIVQHLRLVTGKKIWVRTDKFPHIGADGGVVGVIAISRDISEEKKAEDALRASERRYRSLTELSPAGVLRTDEQGNALYASERWLDITGLSAEQAKGRGWLVAIHPGDQKSLGADWERAIERQDPAFRARVRVRRPDGEVRIVIAQAVAELGAEGKVQGYIATFSEVLEESPSDEAEEALREQQRLFEAFATMAPVGIFQSDPVGRCSHVNARWCRVWGLKAEEALGRSWVRTLHPDDHDKVLVDLQRATQTRQPYKGECRAIHPDGKVRWVLAQSAPMLDEQGELTGHVGTVTDITERKEAEEQIRQMNQELEVRVDQRTAELKAANTELEDFCYCVSHDLRGPLRTLDGFSHALLDEFSEKFEPRAVEWLGKIRGASQHMGRLIDDLLALSRLSRGEIRRRPVNVSKLAREVADELRANEPDREVTFEMADGVTVDGDTTLLHVVLQNLIGNAWKFTGQCEAARIVFGRLDDHDEEGCEVLFVRDNGVGFDMDYADKLFGAFERLHGGDEFEGSGIGLATVDRVVKRHGGRVWAEASPGKGATFYFSLPSG